MAKISLILNLIIFFQATASFACSIPPDEDNPIPKQSCQLWKSEFKAVQKRIKKQFKDKNKNIYEQFILNSQALEELKKLDNNISLSDLNKKSFAIFESCKKYESRSGNKKNNDRGIALFGKCESEIEKLKNDGIDALQIQTIEYKAKIEHIQKSKYFKALKTYEQLIAYNIYSNKDCIDKLGDEKAAEFKSHYCENIFVGTPVENLKDLANDNLEIVNVLNRKLNEPDYNNVLKACKDLQSGGSKNMNAYKYNFYTCQLRCANDAKGKSGTSLKTKIVKPRSANPNGQVTRVRPSTNYDRSLLTNGAGKKKKSGNFWKTAGIVTAAVGVTGLIGWGMYELFKPASRSSYTPPTAPTYNRTFYNYSMDPYQSYQLQQYHMNSMYNPSYQNNYMNYYWSYDPNMTLNNYGTWGTSGGANTSTGYTPYNFNFTP